MSGMRILFGVAALLLAVPTPARAQAIGDESRARPVPGDPGIAYSYVITDGATQVGRGYAQPGATRRMHNHDNVTSHVFVLLTGELKMTVEGDAPFDVHAGDAVPLRAGVNHSFTNTARWWRRSLKCSREKHRSSRAGRRTTLADLKSVHPV